MSDAENVEREVRDRVAAVRDRMAAAAARAGRDPAEIALLGVCKRQPIARIAAAVRAGVDELGGNYVQEVRDQRPLVEAALAGHAPLPRWVLVGSLQRNKARLAVEIFDLIETLDRASLAVELDRRARVAGRSEQSPLPLLVQVNLSREPQKGGTDEEGVASILEACAGLGAVRVTGLMTIPAAETDPERSRPVFARLRELRDRLVAAGSAGAAHLRELSMGMSSDFEVAIEEGATRVRLGTALFGPRQERT